MGGVEVEETAYGWEDLNQLVAMGGSGDTE